MEIVWRLLGRGLGMAGRRAYLASIKGAAPGYLGMTGYTLPEIGRLLAS